MKSNASTQRRNDDEIDLRLMVHSLKRKWYYFVVSLVAFLLAAFLYIRFTLPVYEATSSILVKDSRNTSKNIEDILSGDLFGNSKNMATEIGILHSRSVLEETINELDLGISYFGNSGLFSYPVYKNAPFAVQVIKAAEGIYDEKIIVRLIDSTSFELETEIDNATIVDFNYKKIHRFGETIQSPYFSLALAKNETAFRFGNDLTYSFTINSMSKMIVFYSEKMRVEPINKDATIVQVTIQDKVKERAIDFLNTLGKVYINRDIKDKSSVAALTLQFVDEQLEDISKTLNATELELQKFKEEKGTVNLSEESKAYLERVSAIDENRVKAEIALRSLDYLYDYVSKNKDLESMAPATLTNPDPVLVELVTKLKELQTRKKTLRYGSSDLSPAIKIVNQQIEQLQQSLIENINSMRDMTKSDLKGIKLELNKYEGSIRRIPNVERELLGIQRNFTVNENIYLYLLQKKAETGIAKATAVSDNKVLDNAAVNDIPVIPNKKAIFFIAILLAGILPVLFITLYSFLRNTISNRDDVEKMTHIPIIGVVGHLSNGDRLVVSSKPKSSISEAFRSIRANLMFFGLADQHKIVLITSSVGGEGKSFSTLNLATVLSLQHHRVVIVGMDLRKPQLVQDLEVDNTTGVSTYLIGKSTLESVIRKTKIPGLDIIPAGPIPPNPAELLAKKETTCLLNELRSMYDYIIIDTPPVGIVSDAMMLMSLADVNIFMLRENYSKKDYIKTINDYYSQGKIKNLCIILNDAGANQRYGYGYGYSYGYYGYGYYDDERNARRSFRNFFKRKNKK